MNQNILGSSWLIEGLLYISQFQYNNRLSRSLDSQIESRFSAKWSCLIDHYSMLTKSWKTKHKITKPLSSTWNRKRYMGIWTAMIYSRLGAGMLLHVTSFSFHIWLDYKLLKHKDWIFQNSICSFKHRAYWKLEAEQTIPECMTTKDIIS